MSRRWSAVARRGMFVAGTDTGVGKTLVTCALLHAYAARGRRVVGMKPVASGAVRGAQGPFNDDVARIHSASNVVAPSDLVNPYCFELPVAPHIAAHAAGIEIDLRRIECAYEELTKLGELVIIEGIGGWRVPLNATEDTMDLARRLNVPVLLVVGMRLGCLNHALLTAAAIRGCGLTIAGWVANHVDPHLACAEENVIALRDRLPAPLIARIAFMADPDARRVASAIEIDRLVGVG